MYGTVDSYQVDCFLYVHALALEAIGINLMEVGLPNADVMCRHLRDRIDTSSLQYLASLFDCVLSTVLLPEIALVLDMLCYNI